jgi:hypothetical protein
MLLNCHPPFRVDYNAPRVCNTVRPALPTSERLARDDGLTCGVDSVDELLRYVHFGPDMLLEVYWKGFTMQVWITVNGKPMYKN